MRISEEFRLTGEQINETCFHCGSNTERGGLWLGVGSIVVVCRDTECVRSAMHLIYDAIYDTTEDFGATRNILMNIVERTLYEKEREMTNG